MKKLSQLIFILTTVNVFLSYSINVFGVAPSEGDYMSKASYLEFEFVNPEDSIYINKDYIDSMLHVIADKLFIKTPRPFMWDEYSIVNTASMLANYNIHIDMEMLSGMPRTTKTELNKLIAVYGTKKGSIDNRDILDYININKYYYYLFYYVNIIPELRLTEDSLKCEMAKIENKYKTGLSDTTKCGNGYSIMSDTVNTNENKIWLLEMCLDRLYNFDKFKYPDNPIINRQIICIERYLEILRD